MRAYVKHKRSGETYIAEIESGKIVAAQGPLYYRDVTLKNLEVNWDLDPDDGVWLENEPHIVLDEKEIEMCEYY